MNSTRLQGKVLREINGRPMLSYMLERASAAHNIDKVILATSVDPSDDPVAEFCEKNDILYHRGSLEDVLDRYYQTALKFKADVIVRLTGDCPLIDPNVIDDVIAAYKREGRDYVTNALSPRTVPDGMDVEIFSFRNLERVWREAKKPSEREHVTFYFWKNPEIFSFYKYDIEEDLSGYRLTVDYPEDFEVVKSIFNALYPKNTLFSMEDIIDFLKKNPEVCGKNRYIESNPGWRPALEKDKIKNSLQMQRRGRMRIPGLTHLLSKRPEMFAPGQWPGYYSKAKGVEVWDLDGNRYIDMSICGIGANVLGYGDPDVDSAVMDAVKNGNSSSLNCPEEVELADLLCEIHPWAEMARYARSGGESMAIAVRIARAHTRRDKVAFSGYHGWHDWYLAANLAEDKALDGHLLPGLEPAGVPRGLKGTALPFRYNHIEELEAIAVKNRGELAAIVMEPIRDHEPMPGFLERAREIAEESGTVLIFDEITAAMRLASGGSHLLYGVAPDIAVFAKAISNGYPMAAVIGRGEVMQSAQDTFISSTYWTERIGPAAALATIRKHKRLDVSRHLIDTGRRIQEGWAGAAKMSGLKIHISGMAPLSHFSFEYEDGQAMMTLFTQMMLERGFLASGRFYASYAHKDEHIKGYLKAAEEIFIFIAKAKKNGEVQRSLNGPVAHSGFSRLT